MNQKLTDEQLWNWLDGLLDEAETQAVRSALAADFDQKIGTRLAKIKTERAQLLAVPLAEPSADFSKKIMAQLVAEKRLAAPSKTAANWFLRGGLAILSLFFVICLVILMKNIPADGLVRWPNFQIPMGWAAVFQTKGFLWASYLAFLMPAFLLLERKLGTAKNGHVFAN